MNLPKFLPDFPREIQPHASVACCPARFSKPSDMLRRNSTAEAWLWSSFFTIFFFGGVNAVFQEHPITSEDEIGRNYDKKEL